MSAVDKIIEFRKQTGIPLKDIARRSGVSASVICAVENGNVTHPKLAKKLQAYYGLTDEEYLELIPKNHREGEPNRYKAVIPKFNTAIAPRNKEIRTYINIRRNQGGA